MSSTAIASSLASRPARSLARRVASCAVAIGLTACGSPLPEGEVAAIDHAIEFRATVSAASFDGDFDMAGYHFIVWADGLKSPKDVRYCWKSIADEPFLYNKVGLPAAQFNTTTAYAIKD